METVLCNKGNLLTFAMKKTLKVLYLKTVKTTRCVILNFCVKYDMPCPVQYFGHCQHGASCALHFDIKLNIPRILNTHPK